MTFSKILLSAIILLSLIASATAQLDSASPPVADPSDARFKGVHEDWTTPALTTSNLRPMPPLIGSIDERETCTVEFIKVQWRWGDPVYLYVMKPKGVKNPPVILYLYGYPADTDIFRNEKYQDAVTKDGFAAVGFVAALTGHRYHDRPMKEWFLSELQESLAVSAHDIQLILTYLATRGDLDMNRVGLFAQGAGASIAILTSAVDPRIKVIDALDPWGDWPNWIASSPFVPENERATYMKPEFLKKAAVLEPVDWFPKVQAVKFRLQQTAFETKTPAAAKDKLRAAAPPRTTVVVYKSEQEYAAAMVGPKQLDWIHQAILSLPPSADSAAAQKSTAGSK